jgi:hypothetical protein
VALLFGRQRDHEGQTQQLRAGNGLRSGGHVEGVRHPVRRPVQLETVREVATRVGFTAAS